MVSRFHPPKRAMARSLLNRLRKYGLGYLLLYFSKLRFHNGDVVKQFREKYDKRVIFPRSQQLKFLERVAEVSKLPWSLIAKEVGVHRRTLFDWRREKYSISLCSLKKMCSIAKIAFPDGVEIKEPFWSVGKAAKMGGNVTYKKYGTIGDPEVRKKKWQEWWEEKGKNNLNGYFIAKTINYPEKSEELAEFVGIMMGDGSITDRQVAVTLNSVTDIDYADFVKELMKKLFKTEPRTNKRESEKVTNIRISRTSLVAFCKSIGLLEGNKIKQNLDIPNWIKENVEYVIPCIRGLMDTDGCIFLEVHSIKGKKYSYPRLSLVSASSNLRLSVHKALKNLGFSPKIRNNRSVQIEKKEEIKKYFVKIGTSNLKHRNKYREFFGGAG